MGLLDYKFLLETSVYLSQLDFGEDTSTGSVVRWYCR